MREIKFRVRFRAFGDWYESLRTGVFTLEALMEVAAAWRENSVRIEGFDEYTGLKDKNGTREVYDADILKAEGRRGTVRWNEKAAMWVIDWIPQGKWAKAYTKPLYMDILVSEVIGNLYENPELIEKGERQ